MKTLSILLFLLLLCSNVLFSQSANHAISFNGDDSYVSMGDPSNGSLDFDLGNFSVSVWVRCAKYNPDGWGDQIVYKFDHNVPRHGYLLAIRGSLDKTYPNKPIFVLGLGDEFGVHFWGATPINDAVWHQLAVTVDRSGFMRMYLDGRLESQHDISSYSSQNENTKIPFSIGGSAHYPSGTIIGSIDEVRVWNYVRTQEEIKRDMFSTLSGEKTGLVGYWNLDEGEGGIVKDGSKNNNHGSLIKNPKWIESSVPLKSNSITKSTNKLRIAVAQFAEKGELNIKDAGVIVAEYLNASLHKTGKCELYERVLLQKVLEEQTLGQTGLLDDKTITKIGKLYGVEALVTGTISKMGATISVIVKLIDTKTAKILATSDLKTTDIDDIPDEMDQLAERITEKL